MSLIPIVSKGGQVSHRHTKVTLELPSASMQVHEDVLRRFKFVTPTDTQKPSSLLASVQPSLSRAQLRSCGVQTETPGIEEVTGLAKNQLQFVLGEVVVIHTPPPAVSPGESSVSGEDIDPSYVADLMERNALRVEAKHAKKALSVVVTLDNPIEITSSVASADLLEEQSTEFVVIASEEPPPREKLKVNVSECVQLVHEVAVSVTVGSGSSREMTQTIVSTDPILVSSPKRPPLSVSTGPSIGLSCEKPSKAFATFAAITALVKMQRRIKRNYQAQREDLIKSLGLL